VKVIDKPLWPPLTHAHGVGSHSLSMDRTLGAFDGLAVSLVSTARLSDQVWPFVTIPNFAVRISKVLPNANAINMYVVPVVEPSLRKQWEAYSIQNDGWVDESVAVQDAWNAYHGPVIYNGTKQSVVHGDFGVIPSNIRYQYRRSVSVVAPRTQANKSVLKLPDASLNHAVA
jgi:hypothetical protein